MKKIKAPIFSPNELNSNIAYGMTSVNNITQDELDSIQWLCEAYINLKNEVHQVKLNELFEKEKKEKAWKYVEQLKKSTTNEEQDNTRETLEKENKHLHSILDNLEQFLWEGLNNENFDKYQAYNEAFTKLKQLKRNK